MINQALSVRSDHSIGDSIMQTNVVVETAKRFGFKSVALADTMTVSGLASFSKQCEKAEIKPIIGCTLRVVDDPTYRKPGKASGEIEKPNPLYTLKVYVKGDAGLRSLLQLLSKGNSHEYFYYHSRVGLKDVLELEDVVVTSGDMQGLFHHKQADVIARALKKRFGDDFYIELCPVETPLYDTLNERALEVARDQGIALVATYPFFYSGREDADSLDVLRAITSNKKMGERTLPIPYTRDWCFDEPKELVKRVAAMGKRVGLSQAEAKQCFVSAASIVNACNYKFEKMEPCLPQMAEDPFRALTHECIEGWKKRFSAPVFGHVPSASELEEKYKPRLAYELSVLRKLGFSNYFLLVQHIVGWSKDNGILVGPGRGSAGGSLVAYLMHITEVDPIRFGLMFERFINPERLDLPDIDLDFMSSRRHEVVNYVVEHFGRDRVAGISNYSTLGPASAIRDVSRVHDLPPFEYACSKQVEKEHGVSIPLADSGESVPDIARFKEAHPTIWNHALKLEGAMRNLGQHAAGVIVASEPLSYRAAVYARKPDELPVVNWDKDVVEDFGLIKMDILGLSTLDILYKAAQFIYDRHKKRIDYTKIALDDPKVLAEFGKGHTVAVFQFESGGMQKLLKDLAKTEPLTFEDLAAATALYRPGPIDAGLVDQYIAVKQGKVYPHYDSPLVEPVLRNTFGVIVYQEQIMGVCRELAGFTGAEADGVRKAMGKKDHDRMASYKEKFVTGAVAGGMDEIEAETLWEKMALFAGYAFNLSHSVEYSVISYLSMWLKVYYPAEFFAAAMSVVEREEKLTSLVLDAQRCGLKVIPPDINASSNVVEIRGEDELCAPFQAIKGISNNVANHILNTRAQHGKPFESVEDFEGALKAAGLFGKVNSMHRERLERVGAFASITPGAKPSMHPDRLKDRLELMPGFTVEAVKADRGLSDDRLAKLKIIELLEKVRKCEACDLKCEAHPTSTIGKSPRFMMVFDTPNWQEAKAGKMFAGDNAAYVKAALKDAGLSAQDGYFTALVKAPKPKGAKQLTTAQINGCSGYLADEINILKPAVIVAMGTNAIRYFSPGVKGAPAELAGKVIYRPDLDASIVFGINPATIHFDGSKIKPLQETIARVSELLS